MKQTRRTAGIILACLLLPPLLLGGLLKAGHYTFKTWKYSLTYHHWFLGGSSSPIDDSEQPVPGFDLAFDRYRLKIYRPQDVPQPIRWYLVTAQVRNTYKHGISFARLHVYDLAGNIVDDPSLVVFLSNGGFAYQHVGLIGVYDVAARRHGYLPIKKRVQVGPNSTFVKFVLPRAVRGDAPSRRLPASAR